MTESPDSWSNLEWAKFFIARKILEGEALSSEERVLAAEWITGRPAYVAQKKRGRPTGITDEAVDFALWFNDLRPNCKSDADCYRKMAEEMAQVGKSVEVDTIRKRVEVGREHLKTPDYSAIAVSLANLFKRNVLKQEEKKRFEK